MSRLFSMEPVGILNAWTTNVRMNRARMTAMTIDSKYSRTADFLNGLGMPCSTSRAETAKGWRGLLFGSHLEHCQKSLLRNLYPPDALHSFLAFFLLFKQLSLARDVAAITLGEDVLSQRLHRLACDHAAPDRRLNRNFEHLSRNQLAHLRRQRTPAFVGRIAMY